eukprot:TRINITY_DN29628_c0_g1_i1.p1 TRINITY_DN29628_c0_g1~~TRINITY_DN29628_c0_g1_i1.p1  ORF type:complete len:370 (+),score=44.19 TRINITY_DN29628_c0_g1_i1:54-1163(+)
MSLPPSEDLAPQDQNQGYIDKYGNSIGYALFFIAMSQIVILLGLLVWVKKRKMEKSRLAREELEKTYIENQNDGTLASMIGRFNSGYEVGPRVGVGSCAEVYRARRKNGDLFVLKKIRVRQNMAESALQTLVKNVGEMKNLQHPNVIRVYGCKHEVPFVTIRMELATKGSLAELVRDRPLDEATARGYMRDILCGLQYIHTKNILHRDLKGANILISEDDTAKLSDFGACKDLESQVCGTMVGTPQWMSPEAAQGEVGIESDVWSAGCCLVEMLSGGHPPWGEFNNHYHALFIIGSWIKPLPPRIPPNLTPDCMSFLALCFSPTPKNRATPTALLQHSFLNARFEPPNLLSPKSSPFLQTTVSCSDDLL